MVWLKAVHMKNIRTGRQDQEVGREEVTVSSVNCDDSYARATHRKPPRALEEVSGQSVYSDTVCHIWNIWCGTEYAMPEDLTN